MSLHELAPEREVPVADGRGRPTGGPERTGRRLELGQPFRPMLPQPLEVDAVNVPEERAEADLLRRHLGGGKGCAQDDESPRQADEAAEERGPEPGSQVLEDVERDDDVEAL